jgi:hypothetical protein
MAARKVPFSWILSKDAIAATDTLTSEIVKPGYLYCVQRVVIENETTAYTDCRVAVRSGGRDVLIAEQDAPAADTLYWYDQSFYMTESQRLAVLFTGLTAGDGIKAYVTGWYQAGAEGI